MSIRSYNKLVRERIPEIIEASGKTCVTEILSDEEYLKMLDAKLDEEVAEYHKDQNIEELADLLEVIRACATARGYSIDELEFVRLKKAKDRGGFGKRILLKEVTETSDYSFLFIMKHFLDGIEKRYIPDQLGDAVEQRKNGRLFMLSDHIRAMVYSQLSARTVWNRIEVNVPKIELLFFNFDLIRLQSCNWNLLYKGLLDLKCGSQCTKRQMQNLHKNINVLLNIEREYGSLDNFVLSDKPEEIVVALSSKGKYKLEYVGPALAWEYLRNVGIDGAKPDVHVCRFLSANRLGLANGNPAEPDEAIRIIRDISNNTGMSMAAIDNIIWSFCANKYGEICTAAPHCSRCVIKQYCYFQK